MYEGIVNVITTVRNVTTTIHTKSRRHVVNYILYCFSSWHNFRFFRQACQIIIVGGQYYVVHIGLCLSLRWEGGSKVQCTSKPLKYAASLRSEIISKQVEWSRVETK